jgi:lysozyme family protein
MSSIKRNEADKQDELKHLSLNSGWRAIFLHKPVWLCFLLFNLQNRRNIMHVDALIDEVIAREGGYCDHPADKGGATRWGVTEAVARAYGYRGHMRSYPREDAVAVYRRIYWLRPGFADVAVHAPAIAAELFDTGVNMGPAVAVGFLQRALNALNRGQKDYRDIAVDRRVGSATIDALRRFLGTRGDSGEKVLLKAIEALQGERYLALAEQRPANEAFLYGWLANRLG